MLSFYDLTLSGVAIYISFSHFTEIDSIARKYAKLLPHVFEEWEYFEKAGVKEIVLRNLKKTIGILHEQIAFGYFGPQGRLDLEEMKEHIEEQTLIPWLLHVKVGFWPSKEDEDEKLGYVRSYVPSFQKAIHANKELWCYLKPIIKKERDKLKEVLAKVDMILEEKEGSIQD